MPLFKRRGRGFCTEDIHSKVIMNISVRLILPEDVPAVDTLRLSAYSAASWFQVTDPRNICRESDPASAKVLVAVNDADPLKILATVGVATVHSRAQLEELIGARVPERVPDTKVLSIMRLAVDRSAQGGALNHAMRLAFLEAAQASDAWGFCSSQAIGTPNIAGMKQLGYDFEEVDSSTQKTVSVPHPRLLVNTLHRDSFEGAIQKVRRLLAQKEVSVHWRGPGLEF